MVYPLPQHLIKEANYIASKRNKGIRITDKKCRRIFKGTVPFTLEFGELNNRRLFWDHIYAKKLNKWVISTEVLRRFAKQGKVKTRITDAIKMKEIDIHKQYLKADKKLRNCAKSGKEKRSNWLNRLAEIRQEEENKMRNNKYKQSKSRKLPKKYSHLWN